MRIGSAGEAFFVEETDKVIQFTSHTHKLITIHKKENIELGTSPISSPPIPSAPFPTFDKKEEIQKTHETDSKLISAPESTISSPISIPLKGKNNVAQQATDENEIMEQEVRFKSFGGRNIHFSQHFQNSQPEKTMEWAW